MTARETEQTAWDIAEKEFDAAVEFFEANRRAITAEYGGRHVAILNGKVIDSDIDRVALSRRTFERLGNRPLYMPYVDSSGEDRRPRTTWRPGMILR